MRNLRALAAAGQQPIVIAPHNVGQLTQTVFKKIAAAFGLHATSAEIAFSLQPVNIARTPFSLILAGSLFKFSEIVAAKPINHWGPHYDPTNGAPDAFTHAAYAGLLALRYGVTYAKTLTTLHETGTPQHNLLQINARTMDLHNNEVGIKLAQAIEAAPTPGKNISLPTFGIAHSRKEAELLGILLVASQPNSGLKSGLVTLGRPGSSEAQVKHDPAIYSLDTGRRVRGKLRW